MIPTIWFKSSDAYRCAVALIHGLWAIEHELVDECRRRARVQVNGNVEIGCSLPEWVVGRAVVVVEGVLRLTSQSATLMLGERQARNALLSEPAV
jgi:hypothetical protein